MPTLGGLLMTGWALIMLLFAAVPASAQFGAFGPTGPSHIKASLIAETQQPAPGSRVTMAIVMKPDKGWHGYWENPGDAGVGMTVDWSLPQGLMAGSLRYPVPERLLISGLMNHVYKHDYTLLFDLDIPRDAKPGSVLAVFGTGHWLACTDSICVPEQGTLSTSLTIGNGAIAPDARAQFDGFRSALPRPLDQTAHYSVQGDRIIIATPYPAAAPVGEPWFYALNQGRVTYAAPQSARRDGDMLIVETKSVEGAKSDGPIEGVLAVTDTVALRIQATPGTVPAGGTPVGASAQAEAPPGMAGFLLILGGAFLGGLVLNVMPCVFPILSLKAISLAKAGGADRQVRAEAIAYTGGMLLTCLALGGLMLAIRAAGTQVGWAFQLQDPRVIALLLVLMVAITLNLAGLFELPTLSMGQDRAARGGHAGAFWTGALAAFVATPCTGPFMGAAMGAALVLPWPLALTVFAGLALGLASPFIAIAWLPALRKAIPRPGKWMDVFRKIMAIPMGLTAAGLLWLLSRQLGQLGLGIGLAIALWAGLLLMLYGRAQQQGKQVHWSFGLGAVAAVCLAAVAAPAYVPAGKAPADAGLFGQPFDAKQLAAWRAAKSPVFLYFTADWCLTCKVNEANAIERDEVRKAFDAGGVKTMVGDWTRSDPAITRFLEANGRSGVPLYLFYAPGAATPQVLPQVLTPGTLTALAAR